jgi:hypothetical protein
MTVHFPPRPSCRRRCPSSLAAVVFVALFLLAFLRLDVPSSHPAACSSHSHPHAWLTCKPAFRRDSAAEEAAVATVATQIGREAPVDITTMSASQSVAEPPHASCQHQRCLHVAGGALPRVQEHRLARAFHRALLTGPCGVAPLRVVPPRPPLPSRSSLPGSSSSTSCSTPSPMRVRTHGQSVLLSLPVRHAWGQAGEEHVVGWEEGTPRWRNARRKSATKTAAAGEKGHRHQ